MSFQLPPLATPAPAAAAASAAAGALVAAAAPSGAAAATVTGSSFDSFASLLGVVQDAWARSTDLAHLAASLAHYAPDMAKVQEERPNATARASIQSKNVEIDGIKLNMDERTVAYILDVSQQLHLNELDSLRLVYQSAQSLSRSSPSFARGSGEEMQSQIKARAVELFYKRRFNLLTALLDLVLMERSSGTAGAGLAEEDPVARVVGEALGELVRRGLARNVMIAIEAAHNYPQPTVAPGAPPAPVAPTPPLLAAYRATELSYLLRILFALFRAGSGAGVAHDVPSEDLLRLVELIQTRSAALTTAAQAQQDAQAKALAGQKLLLAGGAPQYGAAAPSAVSPLDPSATFNCYVLLCSFLAALECKYNSLAGSLSARSDDAASTDRAVAASQANADADLAQLLATLQRAITSAENWQHDVLRCGALLGWALFLRRVRAIAPGTDITEDEVQNLVLEGLGGSEDSGFWIHLHEQIQSNPSFAGLRKDSPLSVASAVAGTSSPTGATASAALLDELSEVLGEFLHHCLVHHGKEMDLLRREDKKTEHAYQKQLARQQQLIQAQQQQQHMYALQQHGYQQYGGVGLGGSQAAVPELPPAPKLNFAAFLSVLSTVVSATPSLVPFLWSAPEFEQFLEAELHDSKSAAAGLQGAAPMRGGAVSVGGSDLGLSSNTGSSFHASGSGSIFTSDSPFLRLYLELLGALCSDALAAMEVYNFVRRCSRISWEMIVSNFLQQSLIANYLPQPTAAQPSAGRGYGSAQNPNFRSAVAPPPPPPLSARQLDLLSSLLGLLSALLRPSPPLQSFFAQHPEWKLLDTMFALLGLPGLGVHLKARVVSCVASMVRLNQPLALMAWERLERSQILPTVAFADVLAGGQARSQLAVGGVAAPLEGLLFDLEEIEGTMQTYPLTQSFLDLLATLLESAPMPRQLGMGVRNTQTTGALATVAPIGLYGCAPYLSFALGRVFLNLPHRLYAQPMEQFALAETCLAVFTAEVAEWIADLQAAEAAGVRVEAAAGGSFNARHLSHQFSNPNGSYAPVQQSATQVALQALAVHPAYALLRDLLSGAEVLRQVLAVLTVSHGLLEGETAPDMPLHPSVEGSLLLALKLLWTVLEKEDAICAALGRIELASGGNGVHGRFSPLSTLLLQSQPAVLTLARTVGYVQTHAATSMQKLLTEKAARSAARRRAKGQDSTIDQNAQQQNALNQSMYEEAEDESMLTDRALGTSVDSVPSESPTTEVAFFAASSLLLLSVRDDSRLVHILEANGASGLVVSAFVRQLKNVQLPASEVPGEITDPDLSCNKARLVILDLLLSSLHAGSTATPHISLALLLLGFDIATPAAVQQSELVRSPRRELFDALFFDLAVKPAVARHFPTLAQSVDQLLYKLLSHPLTSGPIVRCIKAHPQGEGSVALYLTRLLRALPLVADVGFLVRLVRSEAATAEVPALIATTGASHQVYQALSQLSWVLKSVNLHYFLAVGAGVRSRGASVAPSAAATEEWMVDQELDRYLAELGFLDSEDSFDVENDQQQQASGDWLNSASGSSFLNQPATAAPRSGVKLLDILQNLHTYLRAILPSSFALDAPPAIIGGDVASGQAGFELARLKYFDAQHNAQQYALDDVYAACLVQGLPSKDAYALTRKCLAWNLVTGVLGSARSAFESWKQCVEVVLLNSSDVLVRKNAQRFETILLQTLHILLQKLVAPEDDQADDQSAASPTAGGSSLSIWIALGEELSSLSLTVISKLREVLQYSVSSPHLDASLGLAASPRSAQLHAILSLLVAAILATRHSSTRLNLYAIFLNYILYAKERNEAVERSMAPTEGDDQDADPSYSSRWLAIQQEQLRLDSQNLSLLSAHNLPLLTLVVNDALDGSSKLRSVSFRFLNMMLLGSSAHSSMQVAGRTVTSKSNLAGPSRFFSSRSTQEVLPSTYTSSCLAIFAKNNLLLLFLNQLKGQDAALQSAIYASGAQALHHYDLLLNLEACLSFFLQLAMTAEGARMMVDYQLVRVLTTLQFLTQRPTPSGHTVGEYESAATSAMPTPFEKYQSVYLLVLQLLAQLLQSLPRHATLVGQVQRFLEPAHHETLAAIVKDNLSVVSPLQLQLLSTALSLIYQMIKEERAADSTTGAQSPQRTKQAKLSAPSSDAASTMSFTNFAAKYQPFILLLLARYSQPQSSSRLRAFLSAHVRAVQQSQQSDRLDPQLDLLLERGDETMQVIFRKVLALLVVQVAPGLDGDASTVALFGPHLGDGADNGIYVDDVQDAHNPASPQLELLLAILGANHARLQTAHRQLFTLRTSLEQLSAAPSAPTSSGSLAYPDLNGTGGGAGASSSIAALELEYFPPSAASAFFYQELDAAQRVKLLQQRLQQHLRTHAQQTEKYVWNIEHALLLVHHHVRLYLPSSSSHRHSASLSGHPAVSPSDFRLQAESVLLPLLAQVSHTVAAQSSKSSTRDSQQLAVYQPQTAVSAYQPRLASATVAASASFIAALVQRVNKIVLG